MTSPPQQTGTRHDPLRLDLSCAAEKPLLAILRRFVTCVAEEIGFSGDDLVKIEMAVDEACSNAFIHAYPGRDPGPSRGIELKVLIEHDVLTVQIRDHGREAAGGPYRGADSLGDYTAPGRERYRGLGTLIMKQFMDEVQFVAVPDTGTTVTLRKQLQPRDGSAPA